MRVVDFTHFREAFTATSFEGADEADPKTCANTIRKAIKRNGEKLMAAGVIGRKDPYIWRTGKAIKGAPSPDADVPQNGDPVPSNEASGRLLEGFVRMITASVALPSRGISGAPGSKPMTQRAAGRGVAARFKKMTMTVSDGSKRQLRASAAPVTVDVCPRTRAYGSCDEHARSPLKESGHDGGDKLEGYR